MINPLKSPNQHVLVDLVLESGKNNPEGPKNIPHSPRLPSGVPAGLDEAAVAVGPQRSI